MKRDPEKMALAYIERSEPVTMFLKDCCEENFDQFENSKKVYAAYNAWARINRKKKMSGKEFVSAMRNQTSYIIEYHRKGSPDENYERPMGFSGIQLLKDADALTKELMNL